MSFYEWKSLNLRLVFKCDWIEYETGHAKLFSSSSHFTRMLETNDISVEFNLMPSGKQRRKAFNEIMKINIDKKRNV